MKALISALALLSFVGASTLPFVASAQAQTATDTMKTPAKKKTSKAKKTTKKKTASKKKKAAPKTAS